MTAKSVWKITKDEYLDSHQASILAFHNFYPEGKQGGIEIIQHQERIASCGMLSAFKKSGKGLGYPELKKRKADKKKNVLTAKVIHKNINLEYSIKLFARENSVVMSLHLNKTLKDFNIGKAFFGLDLYPVLLWNKTFLIDKTGGTFPRELASPVKKGKITNKLTEPLGIGMKLTVAPEDRELKLQFKSFTGEMGLYDLRAHYEGGWYQVREDIPVDKTGEVLKWEINPERIPGWKRAPMIAVSQVGYHPSQEKKAIIELDPKWQGTEKAVLLKADPDKGLKELFSAAPKTWGKWLRYKYVLFDFTKIKQEGVYFIQYGNSQAGPFRIAKDVDKKGVWQPTLNTYFPVQMCHMEVRAGGRKWHAACHMDDAMQAPSPMKYFDGYAQAKKSDTKFKPFEHIPHLNKGGWHDAGDYDLAAGSQAATTNILATAAEEFDINIDETTIIPKKNLVNMYMPDGKPDVVEQIAHGVENILSGYRASGHSFCGIIASNWARYQQRGELSTCSDNLIYNPKLKENQRTGTHSGKKDDRFAFTNHDTGLEYMCAAALAASYRHLKKYFKKLADECLAVAEKVWKYEQAHEQEFHKNTYVPGDKKGQEIKATVESIYLS